MATPVAAPKPQQPHMSHVRRFMRGDPIQMPGAISMLIDSADPTAQAAAGSSRTSAAAAARRPRSAGAVAVSAGGNGPAALVPAQKRAPKPSSVRDARLVASHSHTVKAMQRQRKCVLCALQYRESDNIGQWRCRYHTANLAYVENSPVKRYLCCRKPIGSAGCVACDHTEEQSTYAGPTPLLLVPRFFLQSRETVTRPPIAASVLAVTDVAESLECPMWTHVEFRDPADIRPHEEEPGPKGDTESRMRQHILLDNPVLVLRANHFRLPVVNQ